jgi:hypothetical protein
MAAETQYTANTGMTQVSTANANLDGTGTLATVLTAASSGTLIKSINIKATGATTEGMIRFFIYDGTNTRLIEEVHVNANTPSATNPSFEYRWECDIKLKASWVLKASTQVGETFNIIAEGMDWTYYATSVRPESTNYTANTGMALISTANTNLDGSGTLGTAITAGSSGTYKGLRVESVNIQAIVTTTAGMIRFFLYDGTNTRLLTEVPVQAVTKSGTEPAFAKKITLGNFNLKADWAIKVGTEKGESFSIIVEGNDWKYPS